MGLFDVFTGGRSKKESPDGPGSLHDFSGMRVEVFDAEDTILFVARFSASGGGFVLLQQISRAPDLGTEPIPVRLRGYQEAEKAAVHMTGVLTWVSDQIWRLEEIRITGRDNDRASFRQGLETTGELTRTDGGTQEPIACDVVNISVGGVCFRTTALFNYDEELTLRTKLLPDQSVFPLHCTVRRVSERKGGIFEYGCRFVSLGPGVEDRLAKAITELQMKRLKR